MKKRTTKFGQNSSLTGGVGDSPRLELLETRTMLTSDMLVSVFDDTGGLSVLRYDDQFQPVAGGVSTSATVGMVQGMAVADDGSFYVSSLISGQVFHYDTAGNLLGALGAGDANAAPLQAPGALRFGPNGHLYVADLGAAAIFQFDTTSATQQYLQSDTLSLGYVPGGFDFETDGSLVVGDLYYQGLNHYDTGGNETVWIEQFSGINPAAVLVRPDGDVLVGDITLGSDPLAHHQVVLYDVGTDSTSQFINLTTPVGTGSSAGYPPQPSSLVYDESGNLLVGLSPDHNLNGAIQQYDAGTGAFIQTLVSNIGTPTGIGFVPDLAPQVVSERLFYNNSGFDGNGTGIDASDDGAVAQDKAAFNGIGTAPVSAFSSYSKGINGLMVDIVNAPATLSLSDFTFNVGTNGSVNTWVPAASPSGFSVRTGAGVSGSDRVEITWPDGSIANSWLQVVVEGNDAIGGFNTNTGLATSEVFFYGNRIGDNFEGSPPTLVTTNAGDEIAARLNPGFSLPLTNTYDFNKDGQVNASDQIIARTNGGYLTRVLDWGSSSAPDAAPTAADDGSRAAVASALAALPGVKPWADSALPRPEAGQGPIAKGLQPREQYFAALMLDSAPGSRLAPPTASGLVGDGELLNELLDELSV